MIKTFSQAFITVYDIEGNKQTFPIEDGIIEWPELEYRMTWFGAVDVRKRPKLAAYLPLDAEWKEKL